MLKRRPSAEFSLSFLDVICCGFGAVILLSMITKTVQPQVIEQSTVNADALVKRLEEQRKKITGDTNVLNRDLDAKREQLSDYEEKTAILKGKLAKTKAELDSLNISNNANDVEKDKLARALQKLSETQKRLEQQNAAAKNNLIGGIPVDSEYIIFIIDTSGSMFNEAWSGVITKMESILTIYPAVKGIQVMSDAGYFLFPRMQNDWIEDNPTNRGEILKALRGFNQPSVSSPRRGINIALRTFYDPKKQISIYILGDEYAERRGSVGMLVDEVNRINLDDATGNRKVRIHAVAFPTSYSEDQSGKEFAKLVRELAHKNGGAFVGLIAVGQ
jgi:hypothetical protein